MKTLARFATRGSGEDGKGTVDLILGAGTISNTLKPDTIYEIRDILGALTVVEIGESAAQDNTAQPWNIWACGVEMVLTDYRERWLLTLAEWREYVVEWRAKILKDNLS